MKVTVDFNEQILTPLGADMQIGDGDESRSFKLGDTLAPAMLGTWSGDKRDARQKIADAKLALSLMEAEGNYRSMELSDKQREHLQTVAFATIPAAHILMQVFDFLSSDETDETP